MTRDEAAEVLKHLVDRFYDKYMWSDENVEALTAIAVLRGPQPDPDTGLMKCDYCNGSGEQYPLFHENNYEPYTCMMSTISIEENNGKHQIEIDLWDGVNVYAAFEINYCPMCGADLRKRSDRNEEGEGK